MANLTFINHASYLIETEDSLLIVDPWVEGGAFDNGWALLDKSTTNEKLVEYLAQIDKSKYIWFSHEHSDHFSVPFLKMLKEKKVAASFLFQKTLDGRVAQFIREMGFDVNESNDKLEVIDSELSIVTFLYAGGDSYSLTMLNDFSILNINDCVVGDEEGAERVLSNYKRYTKNIDVLLTQFGCASWVGNPDERQLRIESAREKLNRISLQAHKFEPRAVIPFASFVYFSDPENFHTNDSQNTPKDVLEHFEKNRISSKLIILKPWDELNLTKSLNQDLSARDENISHWCKLYHEIKPSASRESEVSADEIREVYELFRKKIFKHFLGALSLLERLNFIKPIRFHVHDLGVNVVMSYRDKLKIEDSDMANCDLSLSAATLKFVLKNEYGANTTHVNGKFQRVSKNGGAIFVRHFFLQEYMKMGYGLTAPFTTFKMIIGKLFHKLQKRA